MFGSTAEGRASAGTSLKFKHGLTDSFQSPNSSALWLSPIGSSTPASQTNRSFDSPSVNASTYTPPPTATPKNDTNRCVPVTIALLRQSLASKIEPAVGGQSLMLHGVPTGRVSFCGWVVSVKPLRSHQRLWICDGTGKIQVQYYPTKDKNSDMSNLQNERILHPPGSLVRVVGVGVFAMSKAAEIGDAYYLMASSVQLVSNFKEYVELAPVEVIYAAVELLKDTQENLEENSTRKRHSAGTPAKEVETLTETVKLPQLYDSIKSGIHRDIIQHLFKSRSPHIKKEKVIEALLATYTHEDIVEAISELSNDGYVGDSGIIMFLTSDS